MNTDSALRASGNAVRANETPPRSGFQSDRRAERVMRDVSAPGYTTYDLWALTGNQRIRATVDDPPLAWVGRAVPMLKALRH